MAGCQVVLDGVLAIGLYGYDKGTGVVPLALGLLAARAPASAGAAA